MREVVRAQLWRYARARLLSGNCSSGSHAAAALQQRGYGASQSSLALKAGHGEHQFVARRFLSLAVSAPRCKWMSGQMISQARLLSSDSGDLPQGSNPQVTKALRALYVCEWHKISEEVEDLVEETLKKSPDELLLTSWRSAQAVEQFAGILTNLRGELDDLSGGKFGGENVAEMPEPLLKALKSAFRRYFLYLDSFEEHEDYLKKKVQLDLGSLLLQIKQRCSGLGPEWGEIGVLGTSGLAGSYVEKRADI